LAVMYCHGVFAGSRPVQDGRGNNLIKFKPSMLTMRTAFKMKLKPGFEDEYRKRHNNIWPELKQLLKHAGIEDYSIFLDPDTHTLFAVQKIKGSHGSQELGTTEIVKKWWAYMADIMETNPDNSPVSSPLTEVFFME
jgi:L-rhamnose mutarotase